MQKTLAFFTVALMSSFICHGDENLEQVKNIALRRSDFFARELKIPSQTDTQLKTNLIFQSTNAVIVGKYRIKLEMRENRDINVFNAICTHVCVEDLGGQRVGGGRLFEVSEYLLAQRELLFQTSSMSNLPQEYWVKCWVSSRNEVGDFCLWEKKRSAQPKSPSADDIEQSHVYFVRGCKGVELSLLNGEPVMPLAKAFDEYLQNNFKVLEKK